MAESYDRRHSITAFTLSLLFIASSCNAPDRAPQSQDADAAVDSGTTTPAGSSAAAGPNEPAGAVEPGPDLITPDGWGPLRIGMTRAEVVRAAGEDAQPNAPGGAEPEACDEIHPRNAPDGVLVMIENGVVTRISVSRNRDIATPEGIRVGDPASVVLAKYGARARVDPHKYVETPAKYVTVWRDAPTNGDRRGIRYEINTDDEVAFIRVGGPSIEYVEGCL